MPSSITFPFGKYKGATLSSMCETPEGIEYLCWVDGEMDNLFPIDETCEFATKNKAFRDAFHKTCSKYVTEANDVSRYRLTFGRHKGMLLVDVPMVDKVYEDYLSRNKQRFFDPNDLKYGRRNKPIFDYITEHFETIPDRPRSDNVSPRIMFGKYKGHKLADLFASREPEVVSYCNWLRKGETLDRFYPVVGADPVWLDRNKTVRKLIAHL